MINNNNKEIHKMHKYLIQGQEERKIKGIEKEQISQILQIIIIKINTTVIRKYYL